ncbi:MAG: hypothetical protein JNM24_00325 [Bdellovibrionaceae bacterium]|nr:hypothetical protein [Pseudobdellovibrionaceae bacterium]
MQVTLYLNADRKGAAASLSGFETPMGNSPGSYQLSVLKFEPVFQTT